MIDQPLVGHVIILLEFGMLTRPWRLRVVTVYQLLRLNVKQPIDNGPPKYQECVIMRLARVRSSQIQTTTLIRVLLMKIYA